MVLSQWRESLGKMRCWEVLARRGWRAAVVWGSDSGAIANT